MMEPQPLDFEKPIVELQRRLREIREHSDEHALDFDAEVEAMEAKIRDDPPGNLRKSFRLAAGANRATHPATVHAGLPRAVFHRIGTNSMVTAFSPTTKPCRVDWPC